MSQLSLRSSRLLLRWWRDDDFEAFASLSEDPAVMDYLLPSPGRAASVATACRFHDHFVQHDFGFWVVEVPGVCPFIGFVGLQQVKFTAPFTPAVEIGWRLHPSHWGRGYATEAARMAVDDAFQRLDLEEIVAFTVPFNHRSRRVMDRLGMTREEGEDFDHPRVPEGHPLKRHVLYRLQRSDWQKPSTMVETT